MVLLSLYFHLHQFLYFLHHVLFLFSLYLDYILLMSLDLFPVIGPLFALPYLHCLLFDLYHPMHLLHHLLLLLYSLLDFLHLFQISVPYNLSHIFSLLHYIPPLHFHLFLLFYSQNILLFLFLYNLFRYLFLLIALATLFVILHGFLLSLFDLLLVQL